MNFYFRLILIFVILTNFALFSFQECHAESSGITRAIEAAQNKNYTEAISILKTEIGKDSSESRLYFKLADFYQFSGSVGAGIKFFEAAVKRNPAEANNYAGLAILYNYKEDAAKGFSNSQKALETGSSLYRVLELFIESGVSLNKSRELSATLGALQKSDQQKDLYDLGYTLWRIKIRNYKRARTTIADFLQFNDEHGYACKLAGDIELLEGNLRDAINFYLRSEKYSDNTAAKFEGELYPKLASGYFESGNADSAEFYFKKSVQFNKSEVQVPQFIASVTEIAGFYKKQNQLQSLINTLNDNKAMFLDNVDASAGLHFICDLAEALHNSGDVIKAFDLYSQAKETADKLDDKEKQAQIFYSMGRYYQELGETEKARGFFYKSIESSEKSELPELAYNAMLEIGKIDALSGDREAAKKNFSNVLRHAQRKQDLELIEEVYMRLAHLYVQPSEDLKNAHYYLNMADAMARQTFQLHFAANHRWVQGLVALYEDDVETAETYFSHSTKIGQESGSYLSQLAGKAGLMKVYRHTNFSKMACTYADSALSFLKNYYNYCASEYSADFFDLKNDLFMPALMAYSSVGDIEKIYETIELYKSVIHYEKLNQVRQKLNDQTAASIQKTLDEKTAQITRKWRELWTISRDRNEYLETAYKIKNEIRALHTEQRDYLRYVAEEFPGYYPFFMPAPKPLEELQEELKRQNSRFVHYFIGDAATFVVVVSGNEINCQRVNVNHRFLENHIYQVSPIFSTEKNNFSILNDPNVSSFSLEQAGKLYKYLVQPIEPWLNPNETVIISKDASLNRIPFEALVLNSDQLIDELDFSNAEFLVEKYAIAYLPSANFLGWPNKKNRDNENLLGLFAATSSQIDDGSANGRGRNNQIRSESKIRRFEKFLDLFGEDDATLFLDAAANKDNFITQSHKFQFLQIDLPASLYEQFPFLARFSFANEEDYLSAYELFNQPLNADIFIMTDAEVQLAKTGHKLAANGFYHALTFAGVPTFVTTLWRQHQSDMNSVSDILFRFERNLEFGLNKAQALQKAKMEFLKTNRVNPVYWASLVLYGDAGSVEVTESQTRWVIWFSTLAVLTLCVFLGMQLRKVFRER